MLKVFEIKKGRTWTRVRANSMTEVNAFCSVNGYSDWRMVGMMSRAEIEASKSLVNISEIELKKDLERTAIEFELQAMVIQDKINELKKEVSDLYYQADIYYTLSKTAKK